jgi:hypothetical protein
MSNCIQFVAHKTFEPFYNLRRFDFDLPKSIKPWRATAERVTLIALPFISLFKPAGRAISGVMGGVRVFTHLEQVGFAIYKKDIWLGVKQVALLALAVTSLVAAILQFQLGLIVSTVVDMGMSLHRAAQHLVKREYALALEELLQAASLAFYLSILLTGSMELTLLSLLLQGLVSFIQAQKEWKDGRHPEAISKLAMGCIRCFQGYQYHQLIQKRNVYLLEERFKKLIEKIQKGRETASLIHSPLQEEKERVVLFDADGKAYDFGTHFHGQGEGVVKGMNLEFRTRVIDGKEMAELDFKVNHVFRDRIEQVVHDLKSFSGDELKDFLYFTQSHAKGIKIEEVPFTFTSDGTGNKLGSAHQITFDGLGTVTIGASPNMSNIYDRVKVVLEGEKNLFQLHELLSFFNLDAALHNSSEDDIERLKIGQLFRIYHPKEALKLERDAKYFDLPIDKLIDEIIDLAPSMEVTLRDRLPEMETTEILPGRVRYTDPSIAGEVVKLGGKMLVSTITAPFESAADSLASILKMGMLSSEVRFDHGMKIHGMSTISDFYTGGADSIYTQLLTDSTAKKGFQLDNLYWGDIRLLLSTELLNTGTYQYPADSFGTRKVPGNYQYRPNIFKFADGQENYFHWSNEVMIKERVPPSMIKGVVVPDEAMRAKVFDALQVKGLVETDSLGSKTILGKPAFDFIQVSEIVTDKLLSL